MTAETIARALGTERASGNTWMARCPAHEDGSPSLAIRGADGKVLLHCHGGCSQGAVIQALKDRGIWDTASDRSYQMASRPRLTVTYDYLDECGQLLYQVLRFEPKDFRQRHPDGVGGWTWKKGERQVLYRLPRVLSAPIVFLVEGEKDCQALEAHGFIATTAAGGAKAPWLDSFTDSLAGREVIMIPDNDKPGRERAFRVAQYLAGRVARLVILTLDGAKDVAEWFEQGHSEVELCGLVDGFQVVNH
jgi:putative DNA primase/helicase